MKLLLVFCGLLVAVLATNPDENVGRDAGLYEGDMRLTIDQAILIESAGDDDILDVRGSITTGKWPGAVLAYEIESSLSSQSRAMAVIQSAMREWEQKTCVRFKKRTTEKAYVSFFRGSGCWSYVGRTGSKQQLSLSSGCWHHGIVIHEIGHALGFYHEQSRPDRDNHVTIMWDNIYESNKHNFKKYGTNTIDSLGTAYDYGSIMHYSSRAFSKNGKPTIVAKKSGVTFGQRKGLSTIDAQQMSLRYSCQTATPAPPTNPTATPATPTNSPAPPTPSTNSPATPTPSTNSPAPPTPSTNSPVPATSCNFDNGLCSGWSQSTSDQFDWIVRGGATPSSGTGPSADHSGSGKYIFIETSYPRIANDKAVVSFSGFAGGSACLSFYYHMYGKTVNQLNVYLGSSKVFSKSGAQGNEWKKAEVSINGKGNIVFEGIRGNSYQGDIAIDDFSLKKGSCSGGVATPTPTQPPVISVKCTFDNGLCSGWAQSTSDHFDWTVRSGATPSSGTGPSTDHSGSGKYIYIETSYPRSPNQRALVSFNGYKSGSACLTFYYHMYGKTVNQLNVYLGSSKVFSKSGAQGNEWKKAEVSINGQGNIVFEGISGSSFSGDIAIDDFSITGGSCGVGGVITPPLPTIAPKPPIPGSKLLFVPKSDQRLDRSKDRQTHRIYVASLSSDNVQEQKYM
ncbi:Meprin A subunit beta [Desmophyllum pertusum]|uniref:Metalloendopeptidase n=1 Tax=Desmophyllum pertusum TaxID=174260 RepID=A0A9W9ZQ55_9CNID|nr:Meprin A subunit beta [Desmophyllum pertusum]